MSNFYKRRIKKLQNNINSYLTLFRDGFLRNASQLISGTIIAQLLIILSAPIITRLFSPEDLGILAIFGAILAILGSLSTLRYEIAIPLTEDDDEAASLFLLSIAINLIYTLFCTFIIYVFNEPLLLFLNANILLDYLWTIPIGILVGGLVRSFTYWALRKEAFKTVAITRIQQGGGMSLAQIALGLVNFTALGLIFGYIFGFLAGLSRLIYFWFKNGLHLIKNVTFSSLLKAGKDHKDLPLYSNWGGLVNVIGLQLPVILFASFFSPYLAGFYMLSQRVANAPVQLVAESVGKVFYIAAIKQTRDKRLPSLVKAAFTILIRISLLPFIVLTIISPELFIVIFGNEWAEAGVYLQLMAVWLLSSFIFVPLMTLFAALNKHKADLVFQIALVTARLVGIYIGATLNSPLLSIAAFSIFSALIYIIFGSWLLKLAGMNYLDQIKIFLQECRIPFILSFILYIYKFFLLDNQMIVINIFGFWSFIFLSFIFISIYLIRSKSLLLDLKKFSN